ncbi:MAG: zinc ribbon domain-containing protein [Prevotella sp.]|nr:zinc ribbon domain-containing protein [Prevotella sp.]
MISRFCLSLITFHLSLLLAGCYHEKSTTPDGWVPTEEQVDSVSFYTTHHYTQNYNFVVTADSLQIIVQQPSEAVSGMLVDTISVYREDPLVVGDIVTLPSDTVDSVWVQVARDQQTIGWVHESDMLTAVAPDNPISRFIDFFSDTHLLIMLAIVVLCVASLVVTRLYRGHTNMVHFRDIDSFYPTLLCLLVAATAVFYSTIQLVNPESWRHFYYHPTLNPFTVPLHLGLFIASVWATFIVGIAALYDVVRTLPAGQALLYVLGLAAVCSVCYVVFTVTTLVYLGYPLLLLYAVFALWRWFCFGRARYACGRCGRHLHHKGRCPYCGAENV